MFWWSILTIKTHLQCIGRLQMALRGIGRIFWQVPSQPYEANFSPIGINLTDVWSQVNHLHFRSLRNMISMNQGNSILKELFGLNLNQHQVINGSYVRSRKCLIEGDYFGIKESAPTRFEWFHEIHVTVVITSRNCTFISFQKDWLPTSASATINIIKLNIFSLTKRGVSHPNQIDW